MAIEMFSQELPTFLTETLLARIATVKPDGSPQKIRPTSSNNQKLINYTNG